ncbi:DUF1972 domain-containing protein [Paludibacterium paludis]|nr:DUF1972 domain-containing protein [Paludibacterium paludis]
MKPAVRILGTRGVPAAHGGFETFAEYLAKHLVGQGWRVIVYCQEDGSGEVMNDTWEGIERVRIPVAVSGAKGTVLFDWLATRHAARHRDLCLTLGYNTAIFCAWLRLKGIPNLINMDGIEWKRQKWGWVAKTWFWLNELIGARIGNHLVADNPGIKAHLTRWVPADKITMIAYGAEACVQGDPGAIRSYGLDDKGYALVIARPEPENSVLDIVRAFCAKPRSCKLVVLGHFVPETNPYHKAVVDAANDQVLFPGAIYDKTVVQALRRHCRLYVHGHQVGGTNPSLVEGLGSGSPVLAHDNPFNRWVVGEGAAYFSGEDACSAQLDALLDDPDRLEAMRTAHLERFASHLTWPIILAQYQALLERWLPAGKDRA